MAESIFFGALPELKNLCAVKIILNDGISHPDIRDKQVTLCRCLLLLYEHIVASPIQEEFSQILVIMPTSFYNSGKLQSVAEKQQVKMNRPENVTPAMLQTCLFYTITVRLAPSWNKAGHLLIQGADFLTKSGRQDAVAISINILDKQLIITVKVHSVGLPPCQLRDFDVSSECLQSALSWNSYIKHKNDSSNWCYVLPSMKMGRIVHFSHVISPECPFKSYKDFQNYWKRLYGYELPHMSEDDVIYCSVYFKFIGEKLFTYPFICLRSQPIQFYPRADMTRVLNIFVDDLKSKMPHLCGFPINMTSTPAYPVKELTRPLPQGNNKHLTDLTATVKWTMVPKNSNQSMYSTNVIQKASSLHQSLEHCSEKSTSLHVENMTSFKVPLESQTSDSSCPVYSTHSGNAQKYVPYFCVKTVNVSQKDNTKIAEGNKRKKYNISNFNLKDIKSSGSPFVKISEAKRNTVSNELQKPIKMKSNHEVFGKIALLPCPSPLLEKKPCISASPAFGKNKPDSKKVEPSQSPVFDSWKLNSTSDKIACITHKRKEDQKAAEENVVLPPKKCKTSKTVKNVDVEQCARNDKLFKLNNADLQDWLKRHGISTRTRDKKEQLVAKIMQFIQQS